MLNAARDTLSRSIGKIDGIVQRGQAADQQLRELIWCAVGGMLFGMLLWAMLLGVIARSLPESWHVPEWMAARQRMIAAAESEATPTAKGT